MADFGHDVADYTDVDPGRGPGRILIGTQRERDGTAVSETVDLGPNEALIVESEHE